jgi:hypothetical protein
MLVTIVPWSAPVASADVPGFAVQQARLFAPDAQQDDHFGATVAIDGDTLLVGAPAVGDDEGAVYVYVRSDAAWAWQQTLRASVPESGAKFGYSVAVEGETAVVGAPGRDGAKGDDAGLVYIFTRSGSVWTQRATPQTLPEQIGGQLGMSVAISGGTVLAGAPGIGTDSAGAAWVFTGSGASWANTGVLSDPAGEPGDRLGVSLHVSGDLALVSASGDDRGALADAGSILAFARSGGTWALQQKFGAPTPVAGEQFGGPLQISDSGYSAIIGSPGHDGPEGENTGCAYIYGRPFSTWNHQATLTAPTPTAEAWFGSGVALDEDRLALVGAFWDDQWAGSAYYFGWTGSAWAMQHKLDVTGMDPGVALFGDSVAMSQGTAVVGATLGSTPDVPVAGSAFVYSTRGIVSGVCRDGTTGLPIEGVEISAYVPDMFGEPVLASGTSLVFTDSLGRYSMSLDTGVYAIGWMDAVYPSGFYEGAVLYPNATPVTVTAGATTIVDLVLYKTKAKTYFRSYNRYHSKRWAPMR